MNIKSRTSGVCCCSHNSRTDSIATTDLTRREFLGTTAGIVLVSSVLGKLKAESQDTAVPRPKPAKKALVVQPVFNCHIYERQEATSWRVTGAIQDESELRAEENHIRSDLERLSGLADFPLEIRPLITVRTVEEAAAASERPCDVRLVFAARRNVPVLEALIRPDRWNLMFVRHRSGPLYYMYIGVHAHYLRKRRDTITEPALGLDDIVVDDLADLCWRLRSLYAIKNTMEKRVVCIGTPAGWGADGAEAPKNAQETWKFQFITVPYPDLETLLRDATRNEKLLAKCRADAESYLSDPRVTTKTTREFIERAFVLTEVFRQLMAEAEADTITVHNCMTTIMPVSQTTACLSLTLLNDEGYLAFCESDFVAIPAGILLHYVSGTPVFFCNPSFPHKGMVTVSHCTAPRKMDGKTLAPAAILTHYESDYGASPKVEMAKEQVVTVIDPDFSGKRWLGFEGMIADNPFFPICRTQLDLKIHGDWERLLPEIRGFHWLLAYGSHLQSYGYAVRKVGLEWFSLTSARSDV